jgi:hypothetical protein
MKTKALGLYLLVTVVFIVGVALGLKICSVRHQSELERAKGETAIYKSQAEKYAETLRKIRETATTATVVEKAQ